MITYHPSVDQGSDEWLAMRRGVLTASEMHLILTPTLKVAANDKSRAHVWELLAQRITDYTEPRYISDDMLRGMQDEIDAKIAYAKHFAPFTECGFVTNTRHGFTLGYSPDGLVGEDGLIEVKSRRQRFQAEVIAVHVPAGTIPADHVMQCQTGLLVTERAWLDYVSWCGGMPMAVIRVYPDDKVQAAIIEAGQAFSEEIAARMDAYQAAIKSDALLVPTERRVEQEMHL